LPDESPCSERCSLTPPAPELVCWIITYPTNWIGSEACSPEWFSLTAATRSCNCRYLENGVSHDCWDHMSAAPCVAVENYPIFVNASNPEGISPDYPNHPAWCRQIPIASAARSPTTALGFLPWSLSDAGPGASGPRHCGRHPKPFTRVEPQSEPCPMSVAARSPHHCDVLVEQWQDTVSTFGW
jgi:hypothetical protein